MANRRRLVRTGLAACGLLAILTFGPGRPQRVLSGVEDDFGYTVDFETFGWVNISGSGTEIAFPSADNSFVGPIPIGFTLPFYENDYPSLYISTNGIISFGAGSLIPNMAPIPFSSSPNNFAAPLWDDLNVGGVNSGEAYFDLLGTAPNRIFVVQYEGVSRPATPDDLLTFEVLIHEGGDICYQYETLEGDLSNAVAGIEDIDGVDGIDQTGSIAESTHVCFVRPPDAARVKMTPAYSSGFVSNGSRTFTFTVKNTGDLGTDTYDLDYSSSAAGWAVDFFLVATLEPLADTNGNGLGDTGPIPEGGSIALGVRAIAPSSATAGAWSNLTVTATSQLDSSVDAQVLAVPAIAPAFTQMYRDSSLGLRLSIYSSPAELSSPNLGIPSSTNPTLAASATGNHHVLWENSHLNNVGEFVTDIDYSVTLAQGTPVATLLKLTNHAIAPIPTRDRFPAAASNATGRIGVAFVREIIDTDLDPAETNSNVYFRVLNADGTPFSTLVNLTNNTEWRGPGDFDVPLFESPRISSVGDSFVVSWIDNRLQPPLEEEDDVRFAIVSQNGTVTFGPSTQANSTAGGDLYLNPASTSLSGNRVLFVYTRTDSDGSIEGIHYGVRDAAGGVIKAETGLTGAVGSGIDSVELDNGNIVIAWIDSGSGQVEYALLNSSYNLIFGPAELTTPDERIATSVSLAAVASSRGAATWMDASGSQFIYYALLGSTGSVVTPPIAIRAAALATGTLLTSSNGGGNSSNQGGVSIFMPVIIRE